MSRSSSASSTAAAYPPPSPVRPAHTARDSLFDLHQALALPTMPSLSFSTSSSSLGGIEDVDPLAAPSRASPTPAPAPLGPLPVLPDHAAGIKAWRVLILVTSVNSFAQKVVAYLEHLGIDQFAVQVAGSAESMYDAAQRFRPDVVVCPFLTARIPESVFSRWITLVVHPGPPGDAGPSSLDWVLMGDTGRHADGAVALDALLTKPVTSQRSHWGTICFQANEEMDGGAVWAWEQYPLPALGSITKAQLYQGLHSSGAMLALITALLRIHEQVSHSPDRSVDPRNSATWRRIAPRAEWSRLSISANKPFLGGPTHERPLLQSKSRRPDFAIHTARDVQRIVAAGDSQPGGQLPPLTPTCKTALFAYGAHVHADPATVPYRLYARHGATLGAVPDGTILAQRDGAVFIKTRQRFGAGAGVWITHGRLPKKSAKDPLDAKVPMVDAIVKSGHAAVLEGLPTWDQGGYEYEEGTWQEVYVKREEVDGGLAMLVYWNFYNGACSTSQCQSLLRALHWATRPERGNVRVLALMGGSYFSNGIALNTIEDAASPGEETWANINAIDDIVEFLLSDTSPERSGFMRGEESLARRGITTVACVRSNAAAGGVALAAACDVVVAARSVVLNPAYRAMGLHGSEFHSFSYAQRTGAVAAGHLLRDMTPMGTTEARLKGLIDIEVGTYDSSPAEIECGMLEQLRALLSSDFTTHVSPGAQATPFTCAPWCSPSVPAPFSSHLLDAMSAAKLVFLAAHPRPLVHYRTEELSQMLLDSFHPVRSQRYHTRREAFIRKYKSTATPARYARALAQGADEEDVAAFDAAPGWVRGEEWAWVGMEVPSSLATSEGTRVQLFPELLRPFSEESFAAWDRKGSVASDSTIMSGLTMGASEGGPPSLPTTPGLYGAFAHAHAHSHSPSPSQVQPHVQGLSPVSRAFAEIKEDKHHPQHPTFGRKGLMGMQGFQPPAGAGLGLGKGDVQFPCLYQAEERV